jgi:3'-5' exoribonuclease
MFLDTSEKKVKMLINEILTANNGSNIEGTFAVSDITLKPFKQKEGCFLTLSLQDKTGTISGMLWDNAEKHTFTEDIFFVKGKASLYTGKNQFSIESYHKVEKYNIEDFLLVVKDNKDQMWEELKELLRTISDEQIKMVIGEFVNDESFVSRFTTCPGGKGRVHHAYLYGLLEHTLSVVKICKTIAQQYTGVNLDILLAAAFFHDIGKMDSYKFRITIDMSDIGRLLGHISIGYHRFMQIATLNKLDSTKQMLIAHAILSHHGELEKGSPIIPMTQEALILHKADEIDSEFNQSSQLISIAIENWTDFDNLMDRRFFAEKKEIVKEEEKKQKNKSKKSRHKLFDYDEQDAV